MLDNEIPDIEKLKDKRWRLENLYVITNKDGQEVPFNLNWAQQELHERMWYSMLILKARQLGVCLAPDTLVLKADLTWTKISEITPGDEIVSVDEHTRPQGKKRRLKKGIVQGVIKHIRDCYKITFDNGRTLICTGQHPWLSRGATTDYKWRSIENSTKQKLRIGCKIRRICDGSWSAGSFEDGWMGGMLDGEGSLAKNKRLGSQISVSQKPGNVLDRLVKYFQDNGYAYRIEDDNSARKTKYGKTPVPKIVISRIDQIMRLIGVTRPSRFLSRDWWVGKEMPSVEGGSFSTITNIEHIGDHEVIDLQTSEGTYIAEGYVSHNTTFFAISFLDDCFWYGNTNAAIIADKRESSEIIFKRKIKYAYDRMPSWTKAFNKARNDRMGELTFENGSSFIVSTGVRSGTYQRLLVSEFGRICLTQPDQAKEIVSGSLNTVSRDQMVVIESTAAGREGYFYHFSRIAEKLAKAGKKLSPLEQRFFFFPWFKEPMYRESNTEVEVSPEINQYLDEIEGKVGVSLDEQQRRWYFLKNEVLSDSMKSEYPSTPDEAFECANEGYYYSEKIAKLRKEGRICRVPHSEYSLTHTAWDIGLDDHTAIWCFHLTVSGEIQVIDYYENRDCDAKHYCDWLRKRNYTFGTHLLPHDAGNRSPMNKLCYADIVSPLLEGDIHVLERLDPLTGIQAVRSILSRCVFDEKKCKEGISRLESYKRQWDDKLGGYKNRPVHDSASHGADAFRMLAMGLQFCGAEGAIEDDMKALRSYWGG